MLKIAITGSTGLVGSRVQELLYHDFEFIPLLHKHLDFTDKKSTQTYLEKLDYDILLHIAGYTNVDRAEEEPEIARAVNVEGTRNLFETTHKLKRKFIYISTDFVFDGTNPPYDEDSKPNPLGVYGKTKYEGEQALSGQAMIVRISYPYRSSFTKKTDFVRTIHSYLSQKRTLNMIQDSLFTPTFIDDIAYGLSHLIANFKPVIYHLVGAQSLSPYEAARAIAARFKLDSSLIRPTSFAQFSKNRAPRPKDSVIISRRNSFHKMLSFEDGLKKLVFEA